jgi:hypothetical protein
VRKTPSWAKQQIKARQYEAVPIVRPDVGNIPEEYPVGVL